MQADITDIVQRLQERQFVNEDAIKQGIVLRILRALNWNVYDVKVVCPEFAINGGRVDYALCHPLSKPQIFIEVKQEATFAAGEDQLLMRYAFQHGVPVAILTDGRRWSFYLPGGNGTFQERRFYLLDLLERETGEIENRLQKYLSFESVRSGSAFDVARADYNDAARARAVAEVLPRAWREMLRDGDPKLGQALSEKVSSLVEYQPSETEVAVFLQSQLASTSVIGKDNFAGVNKRAEAKAKQSKNLPVVEAQEPPFIPPANPLITGEKISWYSINGVERLRSKIAVDVTVAAFRELVALVPQFLELFEKEEAKKRQKRKVQKRQWVARRREDLYTNPLLLPSSIEITSGWWLGTNYSNEHKREMLSIAQRIANEYGVKMDFELA